MKKLIIVACSLLLCACSGFAGTPEEALESYYSKDDNFKLTRILNSTSDNQKQGFYVLEGEVNNKTEWAVAYVGCNDLYWYVKDTIHIPVPKSGVEIYSSKTNTFAAGVNKETSVENDKRMIMSIPDQEYFVWVERFEKE